MPTTGDSGSLRQTSSAAPEYDPFGTNSDLDERYSAMAEAIFGETEEGRERLLRELREEVERRGFASVPTRKGFLLKLLRAGELTHKENKTNMEGVSTSYSSS